MTGLTVNLGERSYPIYISLDFNDLAKVISSSKAGKVLVVTDSNVDTLYSEHCFEVINKTGLRCTKFVFPAGEASKNLGTVGGIYQHCKENGFERQDMIIALGGGVVGDLAGFAAATYLRGINFVQVPTSLIAQCDSSVGGKVGVDFQGGKNLVGAFYQPKAVYIDVNTLNTLPEREFVSGFAEVIKHGAIQDKDFFRYLEDNCEEILARKEGVMSYVVRTNCSIKARIVEIDEKESDLRAILNFGHTVGHAIESVLDFSLLHGECIALGMISACNIAENLGIADKQNLERIMKLLSNLKLPTYYKGLNIERVYKQMYLDKKISGGKLNFILPRKIGEVVQSNEVPESMIIQSIEALLQEGGS